MRFLKERSALLSIKECDLREDILYQCSTAVDKGVHIGGAYSAIPIMTSLYYGGFMDYKVNNPTCEDQDLFILSKGHAVAALAAVYADVGYFERKHLEGSRGYGALIKGHPGPTIPGVQVATGPLGHGISLAVGYALRRKEQKTHNVFCLVGDGELQEGSCWEGIMFAGDRHLSNLCVLVDKNNGQSDNTKQLLINMDNVGKEFEAFGFNVIDAYSDDMSSLLSALENFVDRSQNTKPTAIICHSTKGIGGFNALTNKHKASFDDPTLQIEMNFLHQVRSQYILNLASYSNDIIVSLAEEIGYLCVPDNRGIINCCVRQFPKVQIKRAPIRNKSLFYDKNALPILDDKKNYSPTEIISKCMSVFAQDMRLYTVDSDLSNASGLYDGTIETNNFHAINVGIAECNMMCIAEALASEGSNVWTSTFTPFFDLRAFRRIAVSYQERSEVIADENGWLNEGHNLDITFLATAANLDTAVNGATHMGNDDICFIGQLAHVKIIDVSCPQLLISILKWIASGNKGLVYLRLMRNPSKPLYQKDFHFEYGKGYYLKNSDNSKAAIISSGHGTIEALASAKQLDIEGISIRVIDMPSFDSSLLQKLVKANIPIFFIEQNNGALFNKFSQYAVQSGLEYNPKLIFKLNTLTDDNQAQFIQSGTYTELIQNLKLTSVDIASAVKSQLSSIAKL